MQTETDFLRTSEETREAYRYFMSTDPAMREVLGPIEVVDDPVTGRAIRTRKAKVAMMRGASELRETTIYLDPMPHIRLEKGKDLQGWYQDRDNDKPGSRPRPCYTEAILTQPYGGYCSVGCAFCYVNSGFKGYRGSGLITVPLGYGDQVRKQLRSLNVSAAGYFSSFTDPFLPLEDYYHNTQDAATAFTEVGLPVFFLSRCAYPGWAFDLLKRSPYSYAQKSLNTGDDEDYAQLSPGAIPLQDHIDEVRALRAAGIYTSIQVNPIVPGITSHEDIRKLFERLAEVGNNHVIVKFVEAGHSWSKAMVERIMQRFGDNRGAAFRDLFTENQCGGQKTVAREYRLEAHRLYKEWATELGMTYATCYEYDRGADGKWRSIGADYLTADQCHGHAVPMHVRSGPQDIFRPLGACEPSGCLTCSSAGCGDETLPKAKALRLKDYRGLGRTA